MASSHITTKQSFNKNIPQQCEAFTRTGDRCKKMSRSSKYCNIHAQEDYSILTFYESANFINSPNEPNSYFSPVKSLNLSIRMSSMFTYFGGKHLSKIKNAAAVLVIEYGNPDIPNYLALKNYLTILLNNIKHYTIEQISEIINILLTEQFVTLKVTKRPDILYKIIYSIISKRERYNPNLVLDYCNFYNIRPSDYTMFSYFRQKEVIYPKKKQFILEWNKSYLKSSTLIGTLLRFYLNQYIDSNDETIINKLANYNLSFTSLIPSTS